MMCLSDTKKRIIKDFFAANKKGGESYATKTDDKAICKKADRQQDAAFNVPSGGDLFYRILLLPASGRLYRFYKLQFP